MKLACSAGRLLMSTLLLGGLFMYANEFVKKVPARIQRKHAQQRDGLIEKAATLLDELMARGMTVVEQSARMTREWYGLLKGLATADASCLETAGIEALKEYVASLEEIATLNRNLEKALRLGEEKRIQLDTICS